MTFGALLPCTECNGGQFVFTKAGYQCHGDKSEWAKCNRIVKEPPRKKFEVPHEFAEEHGFLNKYKGKVGNRAFREVAAKAIPVAIKKEENGDEEYK